MKIAELNRLIDSKLNKYNGEETWKLGYKNLGPFLIGLCDWINTESAYDKVSDKFFLARDGFIIKKAFEILFGESENNHYLYLSRRSLSLPAMKSCYNSEEWFNYLVLPPAFRIIEFLNVLKISIPYITLKEKYCIDETEIFYRKTYQKDNRLKKVLDDYKEEIFKRINEQSKLFLKYLEQENFIGDVVIIDIGWHNSIQFLINSCMNNQYPQKIHGYYVGVYSDSKKLPKNNCVNGYLYDESKEKNGLQYQTFAFVSLFESLFLSQEGTTLSYNLENEKVVPVLREYEYKNKDEMVNVIRNIQEGALQFCRDFKNEVIIRENMTKKLAFSNLLKMGLRPSKNEILMFSRLEFENFTESNLINYNHTTLYYLSHLKTLKNDFYKSGWRIAFLKKLIPIPFPHYLFFKMLCKIFL